MLTKAKKGVNKMGKTYRKDPMQDTYEAESKMMELYDKLASEWAKKVEAKAAQKRSAT